jgi:hypothetical protein
MTRLTPRCMELLRLLQSARWLTTSQIRRRFFPSASADAVRKRLRKLTAAGFVYAVQQNRMAESLFTLGKSGKRFLENSGADAVVLERRPPTQLEHFLGVNEIRIAAELAGEPSYFFAYFELPGVGWKHSIIPDAIFTMRTETFAVEFDRGLEGVQYFVRTKVPAYRNGLDGLSVSAVLVVTESDARLASLSRAIVATATTFLYTTLKRIQHDGLLAPIFVREAGGHLEALFEDSLVELSRRQETLRDGSVEQSGGLPEGRMAS